MKSLLKQIRRSVFGHRSVSSITYAFQAQVEELHHTASSLFNEAHGHDAEIVAAQAARDSKRNEANAALTVASKINALIG